MNISKDYDCPVSLFEEFCEFIKPDIKTHVFLTCFF